jgi:hypothetical protein
VRTMTLLGQSTLFLGLLAAPLAAQTNPYRPGGCGLALSRSAVSAGATVTVTAKCGSGYTPGTPVTLTFGSNSVTLGTATANEAGQFSMPVIIPPDASRGMHKVWSTGAGADGSRLVLGAPLRVTRAHEAAGATIPFRNSSNVAWLLWAALLALLLGATLVVGARWRATARSRGARSR